MPIFLTGRGLAELALSYEFDQLPQTAVRRVVAAIRDCVGVAVAGSAEQGPAALRSVLATKSATPRSALVLGSQPGDALWATPPDAALCNGTSAHQLDYDDTARPLFGHLSAVLVPTLLALETQACSDGRRIIAAYAAGFEGAGRLAHKLNLHHYRRGWHATATIGTLGSTLAGIRLLRLDVLQATHALGIAASAAGGLRANFGSDVKPLHAGYAARNGVLACLLAQHGMLASPDAIEAPHGYLDLFDESSADDHSGYPQPDLLLDTDWALALKAFPSCGGTHAAIEAALQLRSQVSVEEIDRVAVDVNNLTPQALIYPDPVTPLQAKFSMQFCVAAALCHGDVGLRTFTPQTIADPAIQALIPRIDMAEAADLSADPEHPARVRITQTNGRVIAATVMRALGREGRPIGEEQMWAKFADCVADTWPADRAQTVFDRLSELPSWTEKQRFTELLAG